jgi:hypothetical protein
MNILWQSSSKYGTSVTIANMNQYSMYRAMEESCRIGQQCHKRYKQWHNMCYSGGTDVPVAQQV